jgi:hypothetical protein
MDMRGRLQALAVFTPKEEHTVLTRWENDWATQPVWKRRGKYSYWDLNSNFQFVKPKA